MLLGACEERDSSGEEAIGTPDWAIDVFSASGNSTEGWWVFRVELLPEGHVLQTREECLGGWYGAAVWSQVGDGIRVEQAPQAEFEWNESLVSGVRIDKGNSCDETEVEVVGFDGKSLGTETMVRGALCLVGGQESGCDSEDHVDWCDGSPDPC